MGSRLDFESIWQIARVPSSSCKSVAYRLLALQQAAPALCNHFETDAHVRYNSSLMYFANVVNALPVYNDSMIY